MGVEGQRVLSLTGGQQTQYQVYVNNIQGKTFNNKESKYKDFSNKTLFARFTLILG